MQSERAIRNEDKETWRMKEGRVLRMKKQHAQGGFLRMKRHAEGKKAEFLG